MSQDFFQCLVCRSFFGNLWKVEKHIKLHENDVPNDSEVPSGSRRRGMLPIKKVTFPDCYVPVVKNQIDPAFLEQYSGVQAKEEVDVKVDMDAAEYLELGFDDDHYSCDNDIEKEEEETKIAKRRGRVKGSKNKIQIRSNSLAYNAVIEDLERRPRRCRLQAGENIRRAMAVLRLPEQEDDKDDDKDYIEELLERLSDEEDDDFKPPSYISQKKGKVGRPAGSTKYVPKKTTSALGPMLPTRKRKKRKKGSGWTCEHCQETGFSSTTELSQHLYDCHRDKVKMIICPVLSCSRPCIHFFSLNDHIKAHCNSARAEHAAVLALEGNEEQDDKPNVPSIPKNGLSCKFCFLKFPSLLPLQNHIKTKHADPQIFKCPCCGNDESEGGMLGFISHIKAMHPERCDPYNERAKYRDAIRQKEKRFKCDRENCEEAFAFKFQLNNHIRNHNRIRKQNELHANDPSRRFGCPVCNFKFKHKDNLRRHFTLHLENNPYTCDFPGCNRKFNSDYNLRRHRALHYDKYAKAQRVQCPLCPQSFCRKDKLPSHLRECHKPSDIDNPSAVLHRKSYRIRMPHCSRIPYFPNQKMVEPSTSTKDLNSDSTNNEDNVVKTETPDCAPMEEIHLVDKIIVGTDGESIHVKGEHLSPQKVSSNLVISQSNETNGHFSSSEASGLPVLQIQAATLTEVITSDPLFKKLAKDDPKKIQHVISRRYNNSGKCFSCHVCEAVFSRAWTLQLHLKAFHNLTILEQKQQVPEEATANDNHEIRLMCGTCAYPAKDANDLDKHIKTAHAKLKNLKCSQCGLLFGSQERLHQHTLEIHTEDYRKFQCKFCSQRFTSESYRLIHEKRVHDNSAKPVRAKKCPVEGCNRMVYPSAYRNHYQKYHSTKPKDDEESRRCMLCHDTFASTTALRRHIDAIHLGKPINKFQNDNQRRRKSGLKPSGDGTIVRRGPKVAGDEWFYPLLQKALGINENTTREDTSLPAEIADAPNKKNPEENVENREDELMSILGF